MSNPIDSRPVYNQRWYDKDPGCSLLVEQIEHMQNNLVREFAAKCLIRVSDQIRTYIQNKIQLKKGEVAPVSLGLPALQGLFIGKREHRRWYDNDTLLQKAIASLYSLPSEGLSTLSFKLSDTFNLIALYDYACIQVNQTPTVEDLFNITKSGLEVGKKEAEQILIEIVGKDLYNAFSREFSTERPKPS